MMNFQFNYERSTDAEAHRIRWAGLNPLTHSSWLVSWRALSSKWCPVMHSVPTVAPDAPAFDGSCSRTPSSLGVFIRSANSMVSPSAGCPI